MSSSTFKFSQESYTEGSNTNKYLDNFIEERIFIVKEWLPKNGARILDVGCYNGFYSKEFIMDGNEVYGIDASIQAVESAQVKGVKAIVGDLESEFNFEDNFFDFIHSGEVIEHLYDNDTSVKEFCRILKKGGKLVITTPNTVSLPRRILHLFGRAKFFEASTTFATESVAVGHIRFFDRHLLKAYIESMGFLMTKYTSDYVNVPVFGKLSWLAKMKPSFGRTLIMEFIKK